MTTSLTGRTLSHYRVIEEINRGGMGIVYRAFDIKLSREVALKVLPPELLVDPERRRRFIQEARAAAALVDARIAVVHEIDDAEGVTFLAMELIHGEKLSVLLAQGPLRTGRALDLAIEVVGGLAKAHEKGIVHRDMKPGNIMVTEDGHAKIIDFGIAKLVEPLSGVDSEADTAARMDTGPGVVYGTAFYMSPEQARGRPVDPRTDIFSFGLVFHEMLAGVPAFRGASVYETQQAIVEAPAPALRSAQDGASWPALQRILDRCLAKKPEDRYPSAVDLLGDLRAVRQRLDPTTANVAWKPVLRRRRLSRWAWTGVGLAVLVGVVAWSWARGGLGTGGVSQVRSVVALPCRVHSEAADAFLSDAIPSTISTYLNQIQGLETKLPPTSVDLERIGGDLGKVAEVYQVNAFVLSSVAVQAERLALTVQLVEPKSRRLMWSREYDGTRTGYLTLVREAAEGVREAVRPTASPVATSSSGSEVELALQRGRYHLSRYGALYKTDDADRALAAFQRVLELDPKRAEAAAGAAVLFLRKAQTGNAAGVTEAETWARRALQLDQRSSRAWIVLSFAEQARGSHRTALEFALKAASFGGQDALAQAMLGGTVMGSSCGLALEAFNEASRVDPLYFNASVSAATTLDLLGRRAEAMAVNEQVLRLEPDAPTALSNQAEWLTDPGRGRERLEILKRLAAMAAEGRVDPRWVVLARDRAAIEGGEPLPSQDAFERLLKVAGGTSRFPAWESYALSGVVSLARRGRAADAAEVLARLGDAGSAAPFDMLAQSRDLAALRGDPRFKAALERSRRGLGETLKILEAARARGELPRYLEKPLRELRRSLPSGPS
jgi:tetratricopeptide (TPR) repeat protein/predicted Ser/Thr protein kinase